MGSTVDFLGLEIGILSNSFEPSLDRASESSDHAASSRSSDAVSLESYSSSSLSGREAVSCGTLRSEGLYHSEGDILFLLSVERKIG